MSNAPVRLEAVPCNLCGSNRSRPLFIARDRLHGLRGEYAYVGCENCSLVYMNPQVVGDLSPLYPDDYEPHQQPTRGVRRTDLAGRIRELPRVARLLRATSSAAVVDEWIAAELTTASRWLDVGCGTGIYLNRVRETVGCEVFGVDVSPSAVKVARETLGIDVHLGTIEDGPYPADSFDVISGWWYLEHVPNPREVVRRISSLLRVGGLCMLAVPNYASLNARIFRSRWYHLDCPRHLCLWSPDTMKLLYAREGLSVERIRYDRGVWGLLGSLQYALFGDNVGTRRHDRIRSSRILGAALLGWTTATAFLHVADAIVVYGRKR